MSARQNGQKLGTKGNINLSKNIDEDIGTHKLELLPGPESDIKEYHSNTGNKLDIQINIPKFGEVLQDGLDNTKEMAEKWGWNDNNHELNWRDTPCELRLSYDPKTDKFNIQVWNELIQIWTYLSLTKEEILKVLEG